MNFFTRATPLAVLTIAASSISHAATMDDYVTCSLVYGALFQAAKNAQHEGMLSYSKPRLQAVLPYLQKNRDNPLAKEKLRQTAIRLEDEIKNVFIRQATEAIVEENATKLKAALPRVFQCDRAFGLSTLPLPIQVASPPRWNKFLQGFYSGCLAKQRRSASSFTDAQIQTYCHCMTDKSAARGVNANTSEQETGKILSESHGACFASMR
jgi:hypothetical protein